VEDFAQYQLRFGDDIQHDYEVIRPIVLFAETMAERSRQTGIEPTVVGAKARRFAMDGMLGLVDQRLVNPGRKGHVYPEAVAAHILYLKQLYPSIHDREIVRIVQRKFGSKPNHHTGKHVLERFALPVQLDLNLLAFADFADAYQARWTVVRMWYEGGNKQSMAGCLQMARSHVYAIIAAFERDGFEGLEDHRTRPPLIPTTSGHAHFSKTCWTCNRSTRVRDVFACMGSSNSRMVPTSPVHPRAGGPWPSIGACMGRLVRGPVPETSRKPRSSRDTCPIALPIDIISGVWLFAISSKSRGAGSIASVFWQATPARFWRGWPPNIQICPRSCNSS